MAKGLDGRQRNQNGQIREKNGATKMSTLKETYPELRNFRNDDTLTDVKRRQGVDTLDQLLHKINDK